MELVSIALVLDQLAIFLKRRVLLEVIHVSPVAVSRSCLKPVWTIRLRIFAKVCEVHFCVFKVVSSNNHISLKVLQMYCQPHFLHLPIDPLFKELLTLSWLDLIEILDGVIGKSEREAFVLPLTVQTYILVFHRSELPLYLCFYTVIILLDVILLWWWIWARIGGWVRHIWWRAWEHWVIIGHDRPTKRHVLEGWGRDRQVPWIRDRIMILVLALGHSHDGAKVIVEVLEGAVGNVNRLDLVSWVDGWVDRTHL